MQFKRLHPNFVLPTKGSEAAGGWDLTMPTAGRIHRSEQGMTHTLVQLGFAAKVPDGHVALILPRSGAGAKFGVELRNTVGVIDADYTGEWMVAAKQKEGQEVDWSQGDRLFQFIVVPVAEVTPELVDELPVTARGEGGFGSTDKKVKVDVTAKAEPATAPATKVDGEAKAATAETTKVDGAAQAAE